MSRCQCQKSKVGSRGAATRAASRPNPDVTPYCGQCAWVIQSNGVRKQVSFCNSGCSCTDRNTSQSPCFSTATLTLEEELLALLGLCIDLVEEDRRLVRQARVIALAGAALALGAAAVAFGGLLAPRQTAPRRPVAPERGRIDDSRSNHVPSSAVLDPGTGNGVGAGTRARDGEPAAIG